MIIYRYTVDIMPNKINHNLNGYGVFGRGTYFSLDDRSRFGHDIDLYTDSRYTIYTKYSITSKNTLTLSEKDLDGLESGMDLKVTASGSKLLQKKEGSIIDPQKLIGFAAKLGHDSLALVKYKSEIPEGGLQFILPPKSSLRPKVLEMSIAFEKKEVRDAILKIIKVGKAKTPMEGYMIANIPASAADALSKALSAYKWPTVAFLVKTQREKGIGST